MQGRRPIAVSGVHGRASLKEHLGDWACPSMAAPCKAVYPAAFSPLTSAPAFMRTRAIPASPCRAARLRTGMSAAPSPGHVELASPWSSNRFSTPPTSPDFTIPQTVPDGLCGWTLDDESCAAAAGSGGVPAPEEQLVNMIATKGGMLKMRMRNVIRIQIGLGLILFPSLSFNSLHQFARDWDRPDASSASRGMKVSAGTGPNEG